MRLLDLDPRWLIKDGVRVGFIFRSPTRRERFQSCFENPPAHHEQWALFQAARGIPIDPDNPRSDVQGCNQDAHWTIAGGLANASFETMTVHPSLDGSRAGNWHGFIINGEIVGGI